MTESCEIVRQTYQSSVAEPTWWADRPARSLAEAVDACEAITAAVEGGFGPQ
jgi:hypothetical protein